METGVKAATERTIYLYGITGPGSARVLTASGVDGMAPVEALRAGEFLCWISMVDRREFGESLEKNMEDLEWLANAGVRHQQVVAGIAQAADVLPARFGTVFLSVESLLQHVRTTEPELRKTLKKIEGCQEWGIKVFAEARSVSEKLPETVSGSDYLRKKAERLSQKRTNIDEQVTALIGDLRKMAVESSASGTVSSGQKGLLWQGSVLVPRKDQQKLHALLERYALRWSGAKRIDCSGPWPAYSFVSLNAG